MKIFHKSKRAVPPPSQVAQLISKLINTRTDDLADVLSQIDIWKWPRSDLNAWTKVLNKFDAVLEDVIRDYEVDKIQIKEFSAADKNIVCEILRFERLLLENSTNRKMFSSYDRLNSFLSTADLDILILALNLLLRPAQQYSAQPSVSHALSISTPRLQSLAKKWTRMHEYGINLVDLTTPAGVQEVEALPSDARELNFTFYRTDLAVPDASKKMEMDTSESTPPTPKILQNGAVQLTIDEQTIGTKGLMETYAQTIEQYGVPESEKFELLCRLRAAKTLAKGQEVAREKLVVVRLLAIAIFGHTHPESQAATSLFLYEPDLIPHLAELLQIDKDVSMLVQTAAIGALDSLARYRNKMQEVLTAVNAGVNHGLLMALFRKTVADIANSQSALPHSFVEALLSFVTYIASHPSGGNMIVGAGLVPLLIQLIDNELPNRLPVVSKVMQLVDNVLYSFQNAFNLFCNSRGVETLVERIEHEVEFDIKEYGDEERALEPYGSHANLPVARASVLKHVMRSMHRMMQSAGTAEGLRGLIDMSLLRSVKKIISNRGLFGPSILPIAINIMATFVHNEPTSLATIQEAGLPETFYRAIEIGIEPAIEVLQAIPNAIGALCLNETGQAQLAKRPSIIPAIFSIFTSDQHVKILLEKEHSVLIGAAIDELIRHHPSLKKVVFESLRSTLSKIEDLGNAWVVPENLKKWYRLQATPPQTQAVREDEVMEEITTPVIAPQAIVEPRVERELEVVQDDDEDISKQSHDNVIVSFIDVVGRFLEGLFQHHPHCKDFVTSINGLSYLGRLTRLPCLPYDYANSVASDSMVQIMRTMTEVATSETLVHLTKLVKESLDDTKSFWEAIGNGSKLLPLVDLQDDSQGDLANRQFRNLVTLHIRVTLLSDVFATTSFSHGRAAINLLQNLMSSTSPQVITDLGSLHKASVWENIVLNVGLTLKGIDVGGDIQQTPYISPSEQSPIQANVGLPQQGLNTVNGQPDLNAGSSEVGLINAPKVPSSTLPTTPRDFNAEALKHLTRGLPTSLSPFFQAIVKTFNARRSLEGSQRKQLNEAAVIVANIMMDHLSLQNLSDQQSLYTYYSVMLGFCTLLLVDERSTTVTLHTIQLYSFYRAGGIEAILSICSALKNTINEVHKTKTESRTDAEHSQLVHAYGAFTIALHLLRPLVLSKAIFESQQTAVIVTRDKKDTDPEYFEPHNFLTRIRLLTLPVVRDLWEAPWIVNAPLSVTRAVIQCILEITNAENEELKGELPPEPTTAMPRSTGPDEGRIQALTDMGFPRSAVERALARTHNNVTAATELLLAQPFPFPPDQGQTTDQENNQDAARTGDFTADGIGGEGQPMHEPSDEQVQNRDEAAIAGSGEGGGTGPVARENEVLGTGQAMEENNLAGESTPQPEAESSGPRAETQSPEVTASSPELVEPQSAAKSSEELRQELNELRVTLKIGMSRKALALIDEHISLLFELHMVFVRLNGEHQQAAIQNLVDDIKAFSPFAYDVQEQPLYNRCRLIALALAGAPSAFSQELRADLMEHLLALLLSSPIGSEPNQSTSPRWLGGHLLIMEALFTLSEEPRSIILPKEDEIIPQSESLVAGPPLMDAKKVVFDFCLKLLALPDLQNESLISILRLLALLTRNHDIAIQFVKREGLALLFKRLKTSPINNSSSYIAIILRHTVEDPSVVLSIMRQSIKRYFNQGRGRPVDISTYVKGCNAMALRDPVAFIETTKALCQLNLPFSALPLITLTPNEPTKEEPAIDGQPMQVEATTQVVPSSATVTSIANETFEPVVHFLLSELMTSSKSVLEQMNEITQPEPENKEGPQVTTEAAVAEQTTYVCFLMQSLTELLFSYDSCKSAFLSYTTKRRPQTLTKERHRHVTLNFLLNELISYGTIAQQPSEKYRHRVNICQWAMSVIVALCVDSSSNQETKDLSNDLVSIRKFVLDAVARAIKELPSSENIEVRYSRLLALSDLCYRLLTVRFNTSSRKQQDETPTHIGKVMLEKNFPAIMTAALADVDLNYPNVRHLVTSMLKPMEHLTKIAIKMSRASTKNKDAIEGSKTESVSSLDSEEEEGEGEGDDREETPDLYRNSALGMYGGEMEENNYADDDEMDEDEEEDDDDVEMDFGEETGSEDTSASEDGAEEDELDDAVRDVAETWDDTEEDEEGEEGEEDLVENAAAGAEEPEDGAEEEEEEDVDDEEVMWQDIRPEDDVAAAEEGEEEDGTSHPIQILHMDQEEPEALSEGDDYGMDQTNNELQEFFGLADAFLNREGPGSVFIQRRRNGVTEGVQMFGRPRNGPPPPREATTHPLLLDTSLPPAGGPPSIGRNSRLSHHFFLSGSSDIQQTIEDLIGGGAVQLFQNVMGRRGAGSETIRFDVAPGGLLNIDRGMFQQRRSAPVYSASLRIERNRGAAEAAGGQSLDPLLTLQRWAEEVKVIHGDLVMERVNKLINHVTLALLPEAVEEMKRARKKEEEEDARRKDQQEKEEAEAIERAKKEEEERVESERANLSAENAAPVAPTPADPESEPTGSDSQIVTRDQAMDTAEIATSNTANVDVSVADVSVADATTTPTPLIPGEADTEMADVSGVSVPGNETELVQAEVTATEEIVNASTSQVPPRVTVFIHGSPVDITDTGIDPTFLEALPDDMREEVLNQHVREQQAARVERPNDSQISAEFLDALPPEIRAEILQQEAAERARQQREQALPTRPPAEMDPASFIASLDPALRQAVLMDQDDGFIQTLPSHMLAEAGLFRERRNARPPAAQPNGQIPAAPVPAARKIPAQHDAIQLLDKSGIATLARLLFFPQILRKTLFKVLVNLCENSRTRTELFNLLLNILQDGTGDLPAVDKSFAQMSVKTPKNPQTPKGKQRAGPEYLTSLPSSIPRSEAVPDLIAQRCLEGLTYIVNSNELSSLFFLTEHEIPAGLRKAPSKKGKGKERQIPQTHYPIVLLLSLLDRQSLLRTPAIMESVVSLLASVTRPLASLKHTKEQPALGERLSHPIDVPVPVSGSREIAHTLEQPPQSAELQGGTNTAAPAPATATSATDANTPTTPPKNEEPPEEKILLSHPPQIPHPILRLIVNILTVGECSGRTFQQSLALIQHLSYIPDARDVIAQELKSKAQEFGQILYGDLDQLAAALSSSNEAAISAVASQFSPASSSQAKLLRVLKTIDYMYTPKGNPTAITTAENQTKSDEEKVQMIYESFRFTPLWRRLGDCLSIIEEKPETEHIATVLLPLMESLMVVCKYVGTKSASNAIARALRASASPRSPTTPKESMEDLFVSFTDAHRKILNLMVRNNPSLMSGSFSLLVHNPRVLDFDNKRNYFNQQLHKRPATRDHYGTLQLNVRRQRVFEDSFQHLQRKTGDQIKYGKLSVRFYDEEGVDAGGVTREWFQILARQMFDPNNALFQPCAADKLTYQPNKNSWVNPEHLSFFTFVGRVIGKAIYDGRLLDAYFARSLYRQLLGKPVDYKDVEWVDPEYYNSLCWILENDPTLLELTFSVEADEFGVNRIIPLKEGGEHLPVTQENRREFVQLSAQYRLYSSIKDQIENLLKGFYEIVPKELITIFNEQELELLISGTPDIDVDEWRAATEYNGYTSSDPNIVWWWRALKSFNRDERAKVLSFATGTSRVPLSGFTDLQGVQGVQRFSIHKAYGESDRLPQAHTCFNQIDLPQYSSYEMLRQQLLLAINEGGEGFAFS